MSCLRHAIVLLLIAGCAHSEKESYPQEWPAPSSLGAGSCPDISGQFGFAAADPPFDFHSDRALRILHELAGFQRILPVPNRVAISHSRDKWFRIEAFVENKPERAQEYTSANAMIRCASAGLFLRPPPLEQKINGGNQTIRRELLFNTASDGSLVFREEYRATSRILLAPVSGGGIRWNRLHRVGP